ncbi:MAG: iron-sulfur cluster assembly protein, partial [Planctomycetota bacterium]|nr:iron-sulfur cluster assembly protein [Planctomycetota bacterium]
MSSDILNEDAVLEVLGTVQDPDLNRDIVSLGFIKDLAIDGGKVSFKVELTTPACPVKEQLKMECFTKVS